MGIVCIRTKLCVELNQVKLVMLTGLGTLQPAGTVTEALALDEVVEVPETAVLAWLEVVVVFVEDDDDLDVDVLVAIVAGAVVLVVLLTVVLLVVDTVVALVLELELELELELAEVDLIQPRS